MYLREHFNKKLNNLEARLKHIEFHNGRGNKLEVDQAKKDCEELVEELKAAIEREPRTPNEYNKV
jgi:septation ring formation regulator EzrA